MNYNKEAKSLTCRRGSEVSQDNICQNQRSKAWEPISCVFFKAKHNKVDWLLVDLLTSCFGFSICWFFVSFKVAVYLCDRFATPLFLEMSWKAVFWSPYSCWETLNPKYALSPSY